MGVVLDRPDVGERGPLRPPPPPEGGDDRRDGAGGAAIDVTRFGLLAFLGTLSMLFIGFTSAYMVRRASGDWQPLSAPAVVWLNTAVLLVSSMTLELARRRQRDWRLSAVQGWVAATGALGALFVAGQLAAWRALARQGIFLATNPHSSFFYMLTGIHGLHLLGGLIWFAVVLSRVRRLAYTPGEDGLGLFATYWHFLDGLWLYLAVLLFVF
jgi:cytochrome c oxidase subunit III